MNRITILALLVTIMPTKMLCMDNCVHLKPQEAQNLADSHAESQKRRAKKSVRGKKIALNAPILTEVIETAKAIKDAAETGDTK